MVENRFARPLLVAAPAVAARVVQLKVHDIDYSDIAADPKLATILAGLTVPTWVFTASTREHAERCLQRIGIADLPWVGIVDTRTCKLETKHSPSSFDAAMAAAGVSNPAGCLLCDDSVKNIKAAKAHGWRTVLVGTNDRDSGLPITCEVRRWPHACRTRRVLPASPQNPDLCAQAADVIIPSLHSLPEVAPELFAE